MSPRRLPILTLAALLALPAARAAEGTAPGPAPAPSPAPAPGTNAPAPALPGVQIVWPIANPSETGERIAAAALVALEANIAGGLRDGGVSNALPLCADGALDVVQSLSTRYGVTLRRVSHRPRNPAHRMGPQEVGFMKMVTNEIALGNSPGAIITTAGDRTTFYQMLRVPSADCLRCHGDPDKDIGPVHLKLLRELYPADESTGFKVGELQGFWKVEFPPGAVKYGN